METNDGGGLVRGLTRTFGNWLLERANGGEGEGETARKLLKDELAEFLGRDPFDLPVVRRTFRTFELPDLQRALEAHAAAQGWASRAQGYACTLVGDKDLRSLLASDSSYSPATVGPVQYRHVDVDAEGGSIACLENGLLLLDGGEGRRLLAHLRLDDGYRNKIELEVMSESPEVASGVLERVRARMTETSVYRGQCLSLEQDDAGDFVVRFHRFEPVDAADVVLPAAVMEALERNTAGFFRHAAALRKGGRSLKRGLLLHGPPGTGKSHAARWLAQSLPGVTSVFLSAEQLSHVKACCELARALAPALVVLEDVDLVAQSRERQAGGGVFLSQLMNELDGVAPQAEVIFLMTTNAPETLEPALAARPGRVDLSIEFPLPDDEGRGRLLDLYGRGLELALAERARLIARTQGASPAFLKELVRKAALYAAEGAPAGAGDAPIRLNDEHFEQALRELLVGGGKLTRNLLGFRAP
jgi:hypothetical protein